MIDKELLNYLKGKKHLLIFNVLLNVLGLFVSLLITASLIYLIKLIFDGNDRDLILVLLFSLLFIVLRFFMAMLANLCSRQLADYVTEKLREDTYTKYLNLNGASPFSVNEMAQLSSEGIEQLRLYYTNYLPSFFYAIIGPILLFILFIYFDYKVALIYLICIPLIPLSIILVSKWAKRIFNKYWDIYLGLGDTFLDNIKGMKELRIFLYDENRANEMASKSEEFRKVTMKVLVMQLYSVTIMDLVAYGGAALGIIFSLLSLNDGLTWYYVLFMILVGAEFFLPLRRLGSAFHVAMNGATAGKKILKLLNITIKERKTPLLDRVKTIEVKNLSFNYEDKEQILENVNIYLKQGLYSIVGLSGSGKSTLAKILVNRCLNYKGSVLYNGILEASDIDLLNFYQRVCYVANTTYLMHKSIRESFLFYNSNIEENKMWELLELVKLADMVRKHGGLDFILKDSATNISGGEKQRLALAYYLTKEYDFYVFDEASSNIDSESEEIILNIMQRLSKTKIVLNITHRLKNVLTSNYIYFLEAKEIKEEGNPQELLLKNSKFRLLYEYQSSLEVVK